jgi:hypothetical protein
MLGALFAGYVVVVVLIAIVDGLCDSDPGSVAERVARSHICSVSMRLDEACARRDRIQAEQHGRRWLRLVGSPACR